MTYPDTPDPLDGDWGRLDKAPSASAQMIDWYAPKVAAILNARERVSLAARLDKLAEDWDDASRKNYYATRHGENGIAYAGGYEDGWDHAGHLLHLLAAELRPPPDQP